MGLGPPFVAVSTPPVITTFHGVRRAVDKTFAGDQPGSLILDVERRQFDQDAAALL